VSVEILSYNRAHHLPVYISNTPSPVTVGHKASCRLEGVLFESPSWCNPRTKLWESQPAGFCEP